MRKVTAVVLVAIIVLALSLGAFAFQNEPDGFRGLKWGDPLTEEMEYLGEAADFKVYMLPGDKMSIGNAVFYRIIYLFCEGRFYEVMLSFEGENNYDLLEIICKERYRKEELYEEESHTLTWIGEKSLITLFYDIAKEIGDLSLSSTVITSELVEAEKKKEAEKAEGDW